VFDKEKVPEKVEIKEVANQYKPSEMPHQKIIKKLTTISNENTMARTFHAAWGDEALCAGCHHMTEKSAAKKIPKCIVCHGLPFDPKEPGRPGIVGAYHRQCMGCHKTMGQKPQPLECAKCHAEKKGKEKVQVKIPDRGAWK
jgi:hypothetical protein